MHVCADRGNVHHQQSLSCCDCVAADTAQVYSSASQPPCGATELNTTLDVLQSRYVRCAGLTQHISNHGDEDGLREEAAGRVQDL
jgi:hypothetical protein